MNENQEASLVFYFTVSFLLFFAVQAILTKNYEFIFYTFFLALVNILIIFAYKNFNLPLAMVISLSLVGIMHLAGGNLYVDHIRLYDIWFIKDVLKYDNIVHFIATFAVTIIAYNLLYPYLKNNIKKNPFICYTLFVLLALGIGSINEIIEFFAVIFFDAGNKVGGYINNSLDFFFNFIGAIASCVFIYFRNRYFDRRDRRRMQKLQTI